MNRHPPKRKTTAVPRPPHPHRRREPLPWCQPTPSRDDREELLAWHRQAGASERTFLVHGEEETMKRFAGLLDHERVERPRLGDVFTI